MRWPTGAQMYVWLKSSEASSLDAYPMEYCTASTAPGTMKDQMTSGAGNDQAP